MRRTTLCGRATGYPSERQGSGVLGGSQSQWQRFPHERFEWRGRKGAGVPAVPFSRSALGGPFAGLARPHTNTLTHTTLSSRQAHRRLCAVAADRLPGGPAGIPGRRVLRARRRHSGRRHALHHPGLDDGAPAAAPGWVIWEIGGLSSVRRYGCIHFCHRAMDHPSNSTPCNACACPYQRPATPLPASLRTGCRLPIEMWLLQHQPSDQDLL